MLSQFARSNLLGASLLSRVAWRARSTKSQNVIATQFSRTYTMQNGYSEIFGPRDGIVCEPSQQSDYSSLDAKSTVAGTSDFLGLVCASDMVQLILGECSVIEAMRDEKYSSW